MRRVIAGASLVLAAAFLTSCSDDGSDAPDDASAEDFCEDLIAVSTAAGSGDQGEFEDAIDELKDTGTPDDIDGDAREGFEILIDAAGDADIEDQESLDEIESDLSDDERDKVDEFGEKAGELCAEALVPDDLPTE